MIRTILSSTATFFSIVIALFQTCGEYTFDYPTHPYQPFDYEHVELNLTLDNRHALLSGLAEYTLTPKTEGLTTVLMNTSDLAISDVSMEGEKLEYRVSEDSLIIQLPDTAGKAQQFRLSIAWQSVSPFGLYKDYKTNFWSSKNPLAHHHWMPGFDYPGNEITFDAYFSIPNEMEVMFNGNLMETGIESETKKKIHWQSETLVPVTGLGFAFGQFVISEATSGFTKVRLFSPENGFKQAEREQLVRTASRLKREIEDVLSFEYPWESLNMVVLPDNYWEERTHGAGTIYLYERLGDLEAQLKRGLYAQWFGEYQRKEQFFDEAGNMDFMRTALHYSIEEEQALIKNPDSLYAISHWNSWQTSFFEDRLRAEVVQTSLPRLMRDFRGVVSFDDYAEIWYEETGIPWFGLSLPSENKQDASASDETIYELDAEFNEASGRLTLVFKHIRGSQEILHSLTMTERQFQESAEHEVLFTGLSDTVSVNISPTTEYIYFESKSFDAKNIRIGRFPLFFLLNQLRNANPDNRIRAALALSYYSDNPDLQLALNDVLADEENQEVRAAILTTMADITAGATGTQEQFLNQLNNEDPVIQIAALKALSNYQDDEYVKSQIRSKVLRTQSDTVFSAALDTYLSMSSEEEATDLAKRFLRADSTGARTMDVLEASEDIVTGVKLFDLADVLLNVIYPYSTRERTLQLLLSQDDDTQRWKERFNTLTEDRDPRIRYRVLDAAHKFNSGQAVLLLNKARRDEFDIRVLLRIEEIKSELSD